MESSCDDSFNLRREQFEKRFEGWADRSGGMHIHELIE